MDFSFSISYSYIPGVETRILKNRNEFLHEIQHVEMHNSSRNDCPNMLAILNRQLPLAPPNAHFYIFTDSTAINDSNITDTVLQSTLMRTATVGFF